MKRKIYFLLVIVAVLAASPIFAAQLTVGKTQKFTTIQAAIDQAQSGDTIIIQAGEYKAETELMSIKAKTNIKIIGQGNVLLVCTSTTSLVISIAESENITIQNIRASHVPAAEGCAEGVLSISKSKKIVIDRSELNGCGTIGIYASECEDLKITNNFIHSNSSFGLYITECKKVLISGNRITKNEQAGMIGSSENVKIIGNRVFQNKNNNIKQNN